MERKEKATEITKKNLETAFWDLYLQKPLEKITVQAITEHAGYSRGTFYAYYKDVRDVLEQLEDSLLAETERTLLEFFPDYVTTHKGVLQFLIYIYELHTPYIDRMLGINGDPQFGNRMIAKLKPLVIKFFLCNTNYDSLQRDYAAEYLLSACFFMVSRWHARGQDLSLQSFLDLTLTFFENGLLL